MYPVIQMVLLLVVQRPGELELRNREAGVAVSAAGCQAVGAVPVALTTAAAAAAQVLAPAAAAAAVSVVAAAASAAAAAVGHPALVG